LAEINRHSGLPRSGKSGIHIREQAKKAMLRNFPATRIWIPGSPLRGAPE
jgi:hypothetical protein